MFRSNKEDSDNQESSQTPNGMEAVQTESHQTLKSMNAAELKALAIEQIKTVYDPEIPVNIYELGLIYEVTIQENNKVHVLMTLTAPACPAAEIIPEEVKQKVGGIAEVPEVEVELTFDPPWDKDMMSEEAMLELGFL